MGWSIGYDNTWQRDIGYGVPAYCDHPACDKQIDRGLSYVCAGEEPHGGDGCGLYFCEDHHNHWKYPDDYDRIIADGGEEPEPEITGCCARCAKGEEPFAAKAEHPDWIAFKSTDSSWAKWRRTREGKNWLKIHHLPRAPAL